MSSGPGRSLLASGKTAPGLRWVHAREPSSGGLGAWRTLLRSSVGLVPELRRMKPRRSAADLLNPFCTGGPEARLGAFHY